MRSENEVANIYGLSFVNETHSAGAQRLVRAKQDEFRQWLADRDERIAQAIEAYGWPWVPSGDSVVFVRDATALVREGKF